MNRPLTAGDNHSKRFASVNKLDKRKATERQNCSFWIEEARQEVFLRLNYDLLIKPEQVTDQK